MDEAATRAALTVALVAEEAAGARALRLLAERGQPPAAVLTKTPSVAALAAELELPRLEPDLVLDPSFAGWFDERGVDLLLNVHSVLNPDAGVLAAPRIGSFNLHPGPLPGYAGFNAPSWAIAEGEERHAVTVHWMTPEMDAGPIAYEQWFEIAPGDTGLRLATKCVREGIPLLALLLADAERAGVPSRPQASEGGHFYWYEVPHAGRLPWQAGAKRVVDLVRAADYSPYPSPWGAFLTAVGGGDVAVVRASRTGEQTEAPPGAIGAPRGDRALVSAGDEWVLVERTRRDGDDLAPTSLLPEGGRCALP
ncbi:MAG: methionyl-tRNA formyltransferase [Solirubrobacterales bacterium]|nr:methionyl-tRNA formyltransferase [Solirubrobacterales bacterium]